ncbi:lysostaphin resistance A-like protein [Bacteroidota bacterium]
MNSIINKGLHSNSRHDLLNRTGLYIIIILSIILFVPLFTFRAIGPFDFWYWMSSNLIIMITLSLILDKKYLSFLNHDFRSGTLKKIFWGIVSAVILYFVFYFGNTITRYLFDFAGQGIEQVYGFKGSAAPIRIVLLMLVIIGPGEEIFWRGVLQRNLEKRMGKWAGFIIGTIIYTGVHVFTGNVMLIVAALVAGLFWGYMFMRYKSMLMNVVSHTIWDITVFVFLPFHA